MGGADAILGRARADFAKGEFRFVAQAVSHLVFADPGNQAARALLADTFEQLGYLAESATWRNAYLFGAQELRQGMAELPPRPVVPRETLAALRTEQLWDVLGVRLNGPKAEGRHIVMNWIFDRYRRDVCHDAGKLRADLCGRQAGADSGCDVQVAASGARSDHGKGDDVHGGCGRRSDRCHRRCGGVRAS